MIELALPAGSLESALTAFNHGADAVYFGLKDFSARKGAVNFSLEDLSKIRRFSLEREKKTYITINTLIDDTSMERLIRTLDEVAFYGSDGIIVQDLGVAEIIRKHYPSLPLHGSTQLAVHTTEGVKTLQSLGFERVVLSRELTLKEIGKIRRECPDVELKAFIHGALCYGFSGLCSASAIKCSRSANGGECAQICRSWFHSEDNGRDGYFFSMEDMKAGDEILALDEMGIDSAKVEGRLKSPEYVAAVTEYYRSILDRGRATREEEDALSTSFLRKSGDGYFNYSSSRTSLLSGGYPGHMGLELGVVEKEEGNARVVRTVERIENHDGIQYFNTAENGIPEAVKTSAVILDRGRGWVKLKIDSRDRLLGKKIFKISDSTKREKTPSVNLPLYRKPVDIAITVEKDGVKAEALGVTVARKLDLSEAKTPKDLLGTLSTLFSESGTSRYTLGKLRVENTSGLSSPFLPPSIMKDYRREFYSALEQVEFPLPVIEEIEESLLSFTLPDRNLLSGDLPWSLEPKEIEGRTYITLPPVTFDERKVWDEALEKVKGKENVTIGLNNIAQINFAKENPQYSYFADIYLYVSNKYTAEVLKREIPSFIGGYLWFERNEYSSPWPWKPTITDFEPPYFISRTCYRHDAMGEDCRGCKRHYDYSISQGLDDLRVKVRNCLTVVERRKRW